MTTTALVFRQGFLRGGKLQRVAPPVPAPQTKQHVTSEAFVRAMRNAVTGVSIVTTDGPAGRFGLTVSAFSSVSAEPPMVLVCINRRSPACDALRRNRVFCVNVLSSAQRAFAETFAGMPATGDAYSFDPASWGRSVTGAPILDKGTASFDCTLETAVDAGTHAIFVGAVKAVHAAGVSPLVYTDGTFRQAGNKV